MCEIKFYNETDNQLIKYLFDVPNYQNLICKVFEKINCSCIAYSRYYDQTTLLPQNLSFNLQRR